VGLESVAGVKNEVPKTRPEGVCLVWFPLRTCEENQIKALKEGTAVVEGFVVVQPKPGGDGGKGTRAKGGCGGCDDG